jgi:hypothetical protein
MQNTYIKNRDNYYRTKNQVAIFQPHTFPILVTVCSLLTHNPDDAPRSGGSA